MKKKIILLIALMVISVGLLSGCISWDEDCSRCGGSGRCSTCDGNGYILTGEEGEDWMQECPSCHDSGMCSKCQGSGCIKTPGFEFIVAVCAIALILLWKRKRTIKQ